MLFLQFDRYGQNFKQFADAEFERLDKNHDGSVSLKEFRACYGRYNLMYRSGNIDEQHDHSHVVFPPGVPLQVQEEARDAIDHLWDAFQHGV